MAGQFPAGSHQVKDVKELGRLFDQLAEQEKQSLVQEILDKKAGLNDKDWGEIADDYDLAYNSETLRKAGVGVKLASDAGMSFQRKDQCAIDTGYMERQKLYDIQKGIRKDLREQSRSELLREQIRDAIKNLPPIQIPRIEQRPAEQQMTDLIVGMGDFHYGASFTVRGLYGEEINEFNNAVFETRMNALSDRIQEIASKERPDMITVMIVGDILDGMLRAGQLMRLEYGVVDSAIYLSEFLCQWLADLANKTRTPVRIYAVRGNHGEVRPLGSKAGAFPEENMERIVMHFIYERFRDHPGVFVFDDDCPTVRMVDVCGYQVLLTHGQGMNIESMAKDSVNLYHQPIDMFMVGHLHKGQTFTSGIMSGTNIQVERVPSLCGMDPYAQSLGCGGQPGATVILMEKGYGRKCVYPIVLK